MLLLTAVNEILPKLGERRVTSTTVKHPTLSVILPEIDAQRRNLLTKGWWFNRFKTTLYPDLSKHIALPVGTYSFVSQIDNAIQRGLELYNGDTLLYEWDHAVEGVLIQDLDFELLPESAAQVVLYNAVVSCYATDIGMEQVVQVWVAAARAAEAVLERDNLRSKQYSTRRTGKYFRYYNALRG